MKNPKCPYCGGEMERNNAGGIYWYYCPNCMSNSPNGDDEEAAYAAAIKQDRPKGKWIENGCITQCSECVASVAEIDWISPVPTDGDCVSRAWLLAEYNRQHEGPAGKARKLIEDAPAVPQEMTAREYLHHRNRICHTRYVERQDDDEFLCEKCVLKEACAPSDDAAEISKSIAVVEAWAREHPEERSEE